MKKVTTTTQTPDQHFVKAAQQLLLMYKSPTPFLVFLTESLYSMHSFYLKNPASDKSETLSRLNHFHLVTIIIEEIIPRWYGAKHNIENYLAEGIYVQHDDFGWSEFQQTVSQLLIAVAHNDAESIPFPDYLDERLKGISALNVIARSFLEYENEQEKNKEAA